MSKSDTPLDDISLAKAYKPPTKPKWASDKQINGFDTETADGNIFMLSVAWEGEAGEYAENNGEFVPSETLWDYITHKKARGSLNMWYNLNFDANVLLSHLLTDKQLAILTTSARVEADGYEITFIPGKFLKVRDEHGNTCTHYDASQFFYTSLDKAAKKWLNKGKRSGIDTSKFGKKDEKSSVNDYILKHWFAIRKYAKVDAELVRDLWKEAVKTGEELDIPMGLPFSTGYLAESYLNHKMPEKPGIGPKDMANLAWDSYKGGRFEIFKRGDVGKVAGPDINSAYPYVFSMLPDPKTLRWEREQSANIEAISNADYGFVKITVTTDSSRTIQPFGVKVDGKLKYPALEEKEITVVKDVFIHAYENGLIEDFTLQDCWLGYETVGTHYPFDFINSMYETRKEFEANGYMKKGLLLKIILNSMYGKTCQTTPKREAVTDEIDLGSNQEFVPSLSLPKMLREAYENGFVETLECGHWFNPFLASYITSITRLELHKRVLEYGLEDDTVMMATDCLMVQKEAYDNSNFENDLVEEGLGNWDYDYAGKAFVIGAGVYEVEKEDGSTKTVTRGFREADLEGKLKDACEGSDGAITIESLRPKTIAEAVWHGQKISDVGQFLEFSRELKPDMDDKRKWLGEADFSDYLEGTQNSKPLIIRE